MWEQYDGSISIHFYKQKTCLAYLQLLERTMQIIVAKRKQTQKKVHHNKCLKIKAHISTAAKMSPNPLPLCGSEHKLFRHYQIYNVRLQSSHCLYSTNAKFKIIQTVYLLCFHVEISGIWYVSTLSTVQLKQKQVQIIPHSICTVKSAYFINN
jgi:hypothetical protein